MHWIQLYPKSFSDLIMCRRQPGIGEWLVVRVQVEFKIDTILSDRPSLREM